MIKDLLAPRLIKRLISYEHIKARYYLNERKQKLRLGTGHYNDLESEA